MDNKNNKKPEYNESVAALWETKSGEGLKSIVIGPKEYDALQKIELGGRLFVRKVKTRKGETSPHSYLEYMTKEKVEAFKARGRQRSDSDDSI